MKPSVTAPTTLALLLILLTLTHCAAPASTPTVETPTTAPSASPTQTSDPLTLLRTLTAQTAAPASQNTSAPSLTSTPLAPAPTASEIVFTPTPIPPAINTAPPATARSNITKIGFMSDRDHLAEPAPNGNRVTEVYVMDPDGSNQRRVTVGKGYGLGVGVQRLLWHPDGQRLFLIEGCFYPGPDVVMIEASSGRILGQRTWGCYPSFSANGDKVVYWDTLPHFSSASANQILILDLISGKERQITNAKPSDSSLWFPTWSPDAKFIAYSQALGGSKNPENGIFIMNADGSGVRQLSNRWTRAIAWSPDGRKIAFESAFEREYNPYGSMDIWVIDVETGKETNLTKTANVWDSEPSWSPDSQQLVFESMKGQQGQIWIVNVDGTGMKQLTTVATNTTPAWVR